MRKSQVNRRQHVQQLVLRQRKESTEVSFCCVRTLGRAASRIANSWQFRRSPACLPPLSSSSAAARRKWTSLATTPTNFHHGTSCTHFPFALSRSVHLVIVSFRDSIEIRLPILVGVRSEQSISEEGAESMVDHLFLIEI